MDIKEALAQLRKEKKRKFNQSADLIINLKGLDLRRDTLNIVINIPHKIKEKKICGFFNAKNKIIDSITKSEFLRYKDKDALKKLVKEYDFFIAEASLMPSIATTFGKVLGPSGKMPSPQLGILGQVNENSIKEVMKKINQSVKLRMKEASIKLSVGNESMNDEEIIENIRAIYEKIVNGLPKKKENIKNVLIKFTMNKPLKINI